MLVVGERVNTSRKKIDEAVEKRDADFIEADVKAQVDGGAQIIDVNAGSRLNSELDDLNWLIDVVQKAVPARLALDSSDPHCLLQTIGRVRDIPMVNSTTAEKGRFEKMAPVIQERECDVVALCMDDRGMPKSVDQVLENAEKLVKDLEGLGVKKERIYLDPLIQAMSTETRACIMALEVMDRVFREFEGVKTICGLSNISFGLPKRHLINRTFLILAMRAGLSAAIVDPLDKKLMTALKTTSLLLGQDEYCLNYITAFREGRLED
jgi:5-methyltetrahydrofolate--homocysteine methyltransferase